LASRERKKRNVGGRMGGKGGGNVTEGEDEGAAEGADGLAMAERRGGR